MCNRLVDVHLLSMRRSTALEKVKQEFMCDGLRVVKDRHNDLDRGTKSR